MKNKKEIFGILVTIIVGLVTIYYQSKDPQTGVIMFLALLGAIVLYYVILYYVSLIKKKVNQLNKNSKSIEVIRKDLNIIKDKLNFRRDVENLNIRISTLENLFKKRGKKWKKKVQ